MTGVELTEAEVDLIVVATALFGWAPQAEAMEAVQKVTAQIVAARLAPVEAERNEALEYKIMALTPHDLDGEIIRERDRAEALDRANAALIEARDFHEARAAKTEALVAAGLGLADEWEDSAHIYVQSDPFAVMFRDHASRLRAALGGAK